MQVREKNYFDALYDVAMMVNSSLEMSQVLEDIVKAVVKTMSVKASSIRLLDSRKKNLLMSAAEGLSDDYIKKGPVNIESSGIDQKVLQGEMIFIQDAQQDASFQYGDWAKKEGIKSLMVVPLMVEKKPIGVLRVYSDTLREFGEDENRFVEAVANLSAVALDNARLHQALQTDYELLVAHKYRVDDN